MLKALIKKQFYEIFRNYFYNPKTNKARSKGGTIGFIAVFVALMLFIAGTMAFVCYAVCKPLYDAGCGWLYYALFSTTAVLFGSFGSIFSTYSGLYLSKDNDLLLSMPIPVGKIITARLFGVYLMGLMYSAVISLPMAIIYLATAKFGFSTFTGALLTVLLISVLVLMISCALGYAVARISVKLKNKSFVIVILSLLGVALYYVLVFNFSNIVEGLVTAVSERGAVLKNDFFIVYMLGAAGEGNWLAMLISTVAHALIAFLTVYVISRSFIKIANNASVVAKVKERKINAKQSSVFFTLIKKESTRFFSSATYMLNCGLGLVVIPSIAVLAFIFKGTLESVETRMGAPTGLLAGAIAAAIIMFCITMNDIVVPSVSLEGKTIWQLKSLPISPLTALKAKAAFQLILTAPLVLIASICSAIALSNNFLQVLALVILPQVFLLFNTVLGLILSVKMANLNWTTELIPIKQNLNVAIAIFGGWIIAIALIAPYFPFALLLGVGFGLYGLILSAVLALATFGLWQYVKRGGVKAFENL